MRQSAEHRRRRSRPFLSCVERDILAADHLHHEDYELDVASKRPEYLAFEPMTPIAVRATPHPVVLRYIARIRLCVGIADEVEFRAWHTDHYERHDDRWQVMRSQATAISE